MIKVGIAIPQTGVRALDTGRLHDYLVRADALGFDSLWVTEQMFGPGPRLDPLALLNFAAAVTTKPQLVAGIVLAALRSPVLLAKASSTLDHLSRGRAVLGVGLGGDASVYPALGYAAEGRGARFEASVRLLRRLWSEPVVTEENDYWTIQQQQLEPKPLQARLPLWFGGSNEKALARAAALGDGWIGAGAAPPQRFAQELALMQRSLDSIGRDRAGFTIAKRVYVAIDDDERRALAKARDWFAVTYAGRDPTMADAVCLAGPASRCADGILALAELGVDHVALGPVLDEHEQLERLGTELLPLLRRA